MDHSNNFETPALQSCPALLFKLISEQGDLGSRHDGMAQFVCCDSNSHVKRKQCFRSKEFGQRESDHHECRDFLFGGVM